MKKCLVITGMHRSHTSYVSQCLKMAGLYLGELLIEGNEFNQEGHFEDQGIVAFHEQLMTKYGLRNRWNGINENLLQSIDYSNQDVEKAKKQITRLQEGEKDFGWKDPRGSLFLPFWHQHYPSNFYMFVIRNPVACVNSLIRRSKQNSNYKFFPILSMALFNYWDKTNKRILQFVKTHPERCQITFTMEDMVSEHRSEYINNRILNKWKFQLEEINFSKSFNPVLIKSANPPTYLNQIYKLRSSTKTIFQELLYLRDHSA